MSGIGPALPPHLLAKRKRQEAEEPQNEASPTSGANLAESHDEPEKRRRLVGPAMPPAPLEERPSESLNQGDSSESEDDDDFGPSLPTQASAATPTITNGSSSGRSQPQLSKAPPEQKPQRDAWMTMPPKQDDLAARMDPSKQRPRGFNTGKSARAAPNSRDDDNSAWHETTEQKQKRLADEMMGVAKPTALSGSSSSHRGSVDDEAKQARDRAAAAKIREHTEKTRGPSLVEQHKGRKDVEADDDPSARAFDREKDMATGMRIGQKQREEMVKKASGFSAKFSGGRYL